MNDKMKALTGAVEGLVEMEYARAGSIYGMVFHSGHEGYGVIAEEVQEARECGERVDAVMYQLLKALRIEDGHAVRELAQYILDSAVQGAAELIQVAAMCEKMIRTSLEVGHEESVQA